MYWLKKWNLFFSLTKWVESIAICWIVLCMSAMFAVYLSEGTFWEMIFGKNIFSISSRYWAKLYRIFGEVSRLECQNRLLSVQRNISRIFLDFSDFLLKDFRFSSKNIWQDIRSGLSCVLMSPLKKVGEKHILPPFSESRTQFSDIWREYSNRSAKTALHVHENVLMKIIFFETFVFLSFSENVWIFSRFSRNFLARLSMLQGSCLEEQFEDKFCSEKKLIYQFEMLSGKFAALLFARVS